MRRRLIKCILVREASRERTSVSTALDTKRMKNKKTVEHNGGIEGNDTMIANPRVVRFDFVQEVFDAAFTI